MTGEKFGNDQRKERPALLSSTFVLVLEQRTCGKSGRRSKLNQNNEEDILFREAAMDAGFTIWILKKLKRGEKEAKSPKRAEVEPCSVSEKRISLEKEEKPS
jgi:hypothetical protein